MTASIVDLAQCMATDLAAGHTVDLLGDPLGPGGTARLSSAVNVDWGYTPRFKPGAENVGVFSVYVSPNDEQCKRLDRTTLEVTYLIDVGMRCQLADRERDTINAALDLAQQVKGYQFDFGLSNHHAEWIGEEVLIWPDRDGLMKSSTFVAVWTVQLKGQRLRRTRGL